MGYLFVLGITLAICYAINSVKKRPAVNPGRVGLIVLFVVLIADLGVAAYLVSKVADTMSSYEQGRFFGQVVGRSVIPLAAAAAADHLFRRKHQSAASPRAV